MRELLFAALFAHDQQGNRAAADSQNSNQQRQRECVRSLRNVRHRAGVAVATGFGVAVGAGG